MSQALSISWNETSRLDWDKAYAASHAAYQQDWAYGEAIQALSNQATLLRACIRRADNTPIAIAQIIARPFAMIGKFALCTHGPAWLNAPTPEEKRETYRILKSKLPLRWPKLLVITPDEEPLPATGLKGLKRVMTGEATVRIDLTKDDETLRTALDQKWRNRLKKAEGSDLKFMKAGAKPAQYRWLLETESKQREKRGYRALPPALTENWQSSKTAAKGADKTAGIAQYRADLGRDTTAAMLFLVHGKRATYHIGWSNDDGRKHGAHNLILWNALQDLRSQGVEQVDLGGVNTQSGAGIARFKLGTNGALIKRAGAYV